MKGQRARKSTKVRRSSARVRAIPNKPGEFSSISIIESSRTGTQTWRFTCRSNAVHLDERRVRYSADERRNLLSMTAWEIEQAEPPPEKQGDWEHIWRIRFCIADSIFNALPHLIYMVRKRFVKRRRLTIHVY